jgi:hypothetical protein
MFEPVDRRVLPARDGIDQRQHRGEVGPAIGFPRHWQSLHGGLAFADRVGLPSQIGVDQAQPSVKGGFVRARAELALEDGARRIQVAPP